MNTKKKIRRPYLVFFLCLVFAFVACYIYKLDKKTTSIVTPPEKIFFHQEYKKVMAAWNAFKKAESDTIHPYSEYKERLREAGRIPVLKLGERRMKAFPDDSTTITYILDQEKIIVGHHPSSIHIFEQEALCSDSMVGAICYLKGNEVPLEDFLKNYPFPFGK